MKKLFRLNLLLLFIQIFVLCSYSQTRIEASSQLMVSVANDATTGTTINQLAKANSSGNAINAGVGDTNVPVYVVVGKAGTTGLAQLAIAGAVTCKFDASGGTSGHYVQVSTTTAGTCHDAGATIPTSGWIVGTLLTSPAANATGSVLINQGFLSVPDASNAANITSGTLLGARMPAYTGDVTSPVNSTVNTIANAVVTRAKLATDGKNWSFIGSATGSTTTVGPIVWTITCRELEFHYIIRGYNGGTPIGRFLLGVSSISTTALTNGSNISQNFAAPTSAPSIPGIPLATTASNIPREGWIHVYGISGDLKNINVQGQNGSLAVNSPPSIFIGVGAFSDLSTNLPLLRAQLTVYDTLVATSASAQTFGSGTLLEGWCRNGD